MENLLKMILMNPLYLMKGIPALLKKAFLSIDESRTKITSELECDNFIIGFKLGIRMMHEVFQDDVPECATFPLR